jgi:exopolyphosphatase/guanosine-5'-triphosphate,3'-diphosphate pyrophosphatase
MTCASLDFGSNTFHLLIAEILSGTRYKILFRQELPVFIGKGGYSGCLIQQDAMKRAFKVLEKYHGEMKKYPLDYLRAYATSAIRDADNRDEFVKSVEERFEIPVEVISGEREADLIYKGIRLAYPFGAQKGLILDIGGGSSEFILAGQEKIHYKKSFKLGMSRIRELFKPADPVSYQNIKEMEIHFDKELGEIKHLCLEHQPSTLIGASGSFDTMKSMLIEGRWAKGQDTPYYSIPLPLFSQFHAKLTETNHAERERMPGLPSMRVETIVLASIFVTFVLQQTRIMNLVQCPFALKEGVLAELMEHEK